MILTPRRTFVSTDMHTTVTAEAIAENFLIVPDRAEQTLMATTQRGTRSAILLIARRYRADRMYDLPRLNTKFATSTLYADKKLIRSNIGSQIYSHKYGFNATYHMRRANNDNVGNSMNDFINDYGIPDHLTYDGVAVQVGSKTKFQETIHRSRINTHVSTPRRPNENPAEGSIREVKKRWYTLQVKENILNRVWDYGKSWVCGTDNVTTNSSKYCDGRTPLEIITGITPDITEYLDFSFYDEVTFKSNAGLGSYEIGRWLGVSHRVGPLMSYWILPRSGIPISCSTVQRLTMLEQQTEETKQRMSTFDGGLDDKFNAISSQITHPLDSSNMNIPSLEHEDEDFIAEYKRVIDNESIPHEDVDDIGINQDYLGMELGLPRGPDDELQYATVKRIIKDNEGVPIGKESNNPLLDSRQFEVEYSDGYNEVLSANVIAENIIPQVDEEGHRQMFFSEIMDHRILSDAIPKAQGTFVTSHGAIRKKRTTKGVEICVQWKDGSFDWISMKDLKDSYPIELAEYAVQQRIDKLPAFAWWVPHVLKKRESIISKLKTKYWQRTHKYGIRIPRNITEAIRIDKDNNNTYWMDAVKMEMTNNRIAFELHEGDISKLVGFKEITAHMIFDVKLGENFRRKARFCADGHKTEAPTSVTYSTVVSRDSVRIILLIAALNDLDILSGDIQNAYLTAPNREKVWIRAGDEFKYVSGMQDLIGKILIVTRALYGLKSAGASFRAFLAEKLDSMSFKSSVADPDVWLRPAVKPDKEEYYEYILVYVDDIISVSHAPMDIMNEITNTFKFKGDKCAEPDIYLGARLQKRSVGNKSCWTMTSVDYINAGVKNLEEVLKNKRWRMPKKATTPMTAGYVPELDISDELNAEDTQFYQELIGMLRWATEIGRVDILHEISILSQYQASPREGHIEQLINIWSFLRQDPKLTLYFDPTLPVMDHSVFTSNADDFQELYRGATEQLPHNMPVPRGRSVMTTAYVDASHAANKKTRRSHSGYIIFVNRAPIIWYSKRQQTVEASTFSSEYIALKTCIEAIQTLRFKLRMFGVPMEEGDPTNIYCDNQSVVTNSSNVESMLNKKHNSIAFHYTRWNVAAGIVSIAWISTKENLADPFTKRLSKAVRDYLFGNWTY